MKKTVLTMTALACALSFSLGLAACGGGGGANEEMTAEKWSQQFAAANNFTVTMSPSGSNESAVGKVDGDKFEYTYHSGSPQAQDQHSFLSKESGKWYTYVNEGSEWKKTEVNEENELYATYANCTVFISYLKDDFSLFTYSDGKYVCAEYNKGASVAWTDVTVTFKKGALSDFEFTSPAGETSTLKVTVNAFGKTTVTLPKVGGGDDGGGDDGGDGGDGGGGSQGGGSSEVQGVEVTATQWKQLVGNAVNFTVETEYTMKNQRIRSTLKVDGDKRYMEMPGEERYYCLENGVFYEYTQGSDQKWNKSVTDAIDESTLAMHRTMITILADDFASFTYSEGKYTCATLDKRAQAGSELTDLEVVFTKDGLVSVYYVGMGEQTMNFTAIGTTTVTLPEATLGGGEGGGSQGGQGGGQGGEGGQGSAGVILTEDTDFQGLRSDEVSEGEWSTAFSDGVYENSAIKYVSPSMTIVRKCMRYEGGKYVCCEVDGIPYGYYTDVKGKMYEFTLGDNGFECREVEKGDEGFLLFTILCPDFGEAYAQFRFNDAEGAYECAEITANTPMELGNTAIYRNVSVKIVGGKLAYIACDIVIGGNSARCTFMFYDYGQTHFDLPQEVLVPTPEEGQGGEDGGATSPLDGKTFVFYEVTGDGLSQELLAEYARMNGRMTIVFEDGMATITQYPPEGTGGTQRDHPNCALRGGRRYRNSDGHEYVGRRTAAGNGK